MLDDLKLKKSKTIRQQISDYLRESILTGALQPGTKLPTTKEMAEQWGTQVANIHAALKPLVNEGLLSRKQGVGTIVNTRKDSLSTIAVYLKHDIDPAALTFIRLLISFIETELNTLNIECRIIHENKERSGFDQIRELADKRLIQGVIVPVTNRTERPEFEKLPVPFACLTSAQVHNRVYYQSASMVDKAFEAFQAMGCKSIGLLMSITRSEDPTESGEMERYNLIKHFFAQAKKYGIELREEWIRTLPPKSQQSVPIQRDHFAFDNFNKIWDCKERPEGMFISTDDLILGSLLAIMQQNLKVPDDLKLVFQRNAENDVLCPVSCYFVESSAQKTAQGLVDLIMEQFSGKQVSPLKLEYSLHKHM